MMQLLCKHNEAAVLTKELRLKRTARKSSQKRLIKATIALLSTGVLLAGCGTREDTPDDGGPGGMDMSDVTSMNDPNAAPAFEEPNAVRASFKGLATAPPGSEGVAGVAWLAQNGDTTVTAELTGLTPGATYMAHLHAQACGAEAGGPHFQFEIGGPEVPPNEVHLGFRADEKGAASATATNAREVGSGARAIVVHPSDLPDNRLVCADF